MAVVRPSGGLISPRFHSTARPVRHTSLIDDGAPRIAVVDEEPAVLKALSSCCALLSLPFLHIDRAGMLRTLHGPTVFLPVSPIVRGPDAPHIDRFMSLQERGCGMLITSPTTRRNGFMSLASLSTRTLVLWLFFQTRAGQHLLVSAVDKAFPRAVDGVGQRIVCGRFG